MLWIVWIMKQKQSFLLFANNQINMSRWALSNLHFHVATKKVFLNSTKQKMITYRKNVYVLYKLNSLQNVVFLFFLVTSAFCSCIIFFVVDYLKSWISSRKNGKTAVKGDYIRNSDDWRRFSKLVACIIYFIRTSRKASTKEVLYRLL